MRDAKILKMRSDSEQQTTSQSQMSHYLKQLQSSLEKSPMPLKSRNMSNTITPFDVSQQSATNLLSDLLEEINQSIA